MTTSDNHYGLNSWSQHELHPQIADDNAIEWIFLIDSLNFSFWTPKNCPQFVVDYKNNEYTGYWSLCAAINSALEKGLPLTDPKYYSAIDKKTAGEIFKGINGTEIPLLNERVEILHENGRILIKVTLYFSKTIS